MAQGYYRYPTVFGQKIVFVSEDDLWEAPLEGGQAYRLTATTGQATYPLFSPDGQHLAFVSSHEGHQEVYRMPVSGGAIDRLTYLGDTAQVVAWDAHHGLVAASSYNQAFRGFYQAFQIDPDHKTFSCMNLGPVSFLSFGEGGRKVIQRHGYREFSFWKRYRGGTAGTLWIDREGSDDFEPLIDLKGNLSRPLWIKDRIYFASDHESIGNIYSCTPSGEDLQRHTRHTDFYVRNLSTDGHTLVYHAGGTLYRLPVGACSSEKIDITYRSNKAQKQRKYVSASRYLEDYHLHPKGHYITAVSRGKSFFMGNWEGPVYPYGHKDPGRNRLSCWLHHGEKLMVINDADGEERLDVYGRDPLCLEKTISSPKIGRVLTLRPSPTDEAAVLVNHRHELVHIDIVTGHVEVLDRSPHSVILGFDWSPDGNWLAYNCSLSRHLSGIKIYDLKNQTTQFVTKPLLRDVSPCFCPEGKYLYFLSYRIFDPTWDVMHFELSFPDGMIPCVLTLQKDTLSPFLKHPKPLEEESDDHEKTQDICVDIDFEGIEDRVMMFPVDPGLFGQIRATKSKVLWTRLPIEGTLHHEDDAPAPYNSELEMFDLDTHKTEKVAHHIADFKLSLDRKSLVYRTEKDLRVIKAGDKADEDLEVDHYSRRNGWVNLNRSKILVSPEDEWRQIFKEAWRLQRDHYWIEDMAEVEWQKVYDLYEPLIDLTSTRSELNDLLWEMQGELGTSHAYVSGGDIPHAPHYGMGGLGADFVWDDTHQGYRISNIAKGDPWDEAASSPLIRAGNNIHAGDILLAINGDPLTRETPPESLLINLAKQDISVTVRLSSRGETRTRIVKTLTKQMPARYRDWVDRNRAYVHEKTQGNIGYIHIPDMSVEGFSEFHRAYLMECEKDGLIIDVRFNGGGCVSALLLEKLRRKILGYDQTRWEGDSPYPADAPLGPMACLTNEYAGSDGDIFSHSFKMLKLGPLIGKRTWGGVIGIHPRHHLVDGCVTTQPEFSFWFEDSGWGVENYGVDPDIEVEMTPKDYLDQQDPQLDRGIQEVLTEIKENPPLRGPELRTRPSLKAPKFPR